MEKYEIDMSEVLGPDRCARLWYNFTPYKQARLEGPPEYCYPAESEEVEFLRFEIMWEGKTQEIPLAVLSPEILEKCAQDIIRLETLAADEARAEAYERAHSCDYTDDWP